MVMLEHSRVRIGFASRRGIAVVLLAICSLTLSLATRFTVVGPESEKVTTVKFHPPDAKKQHLLSNALQWTAPASSFTLFQPPRTSVLTTSIVIPATNLSTESWRYNRPPPSC